MGAAENRAKNSKMAADLVSRGIWHGKRTTVSHDPHKRMQPTDVGSAAYRRRITRKS